ncbi:MAG: hypothetical protein IK136_02415 [Oscillospiraceae bacterium]|nr:hypothetical protein [Oscillospiraceae bacterium]
MEFLLSDGQYVPDGNGGFKKATGAEETLQRALLKLSCRRGGFAPWPAFGSRLYTLSRLRRSERESAAKRFAAEALRGEALIVEDAAVTETERGLSVRVLLTGGGAETYADIDLFTEE